MFKKYPRTKIALILILPILFLMIFVQFPNPWSQSLNDWIKNNVGMEANEVPLLSDGRIDFCTIVNQRLGEGVTIDNNIVVDLYQVMPVRGGNGSWHAKFVELLGSPPNLDMPAYVDTTELQNRFAAAASVLDDSIEDSTSDSMEDSNGLDDYIDPGDDVWEFMDQPWLDKDQPVLVAWLEENKPALDKMVAASFKPFYFHPYCTTDDASIPLMFVSLEYTQQMREIARALSYRAMNHLGEGRTDECLADLAAMRRIGFKIRQSGTLVEHLVGIAITGITFEAEQVVLSHGNFTAEQCSDYQQVIRDTTYMGTLKDCMANGERMMMLDSIQSLSKGIVDDVGMGSGGGMASQLQRFSGLVDWRVVAETCDEFYDELIETMGIEDEMARQAGLAAMEERLMNMEREVSNPAHFISRLVSGATGRGRLVGKVTVGMLLPATAQVDGANIRSKIHAISAIGFEIEKFRLNNDRFPKALSELDQENIKGLTVDLYNGNPIRYQLIEGGYVLYSLGVDGVDNTIDANGVEIPVDEDVYNGDVVVRVKRK